VISACPARPVAPEDGTGVEFRVAELPKAAFHWASSNERSEPRLLVGTGGRGKKSTKYVIKLTDYSTKRLQ